MYRGYCDPDTDAILKELIFGTRNIGPLGFFYRIVGLCDMICKSLVLWNILCILMETSNPVSAVVSNSMFPIQ